jgi:hypothetical protein
MTDNNVLAEDEYPVQCHPRYGGGIFIIKIKKHLTSFGEYEVIDIDKLQRPLKKGGNTCQYHPTQEKAESSGELTRQLETVTESAIEYANRALQLKKMLDAICTKLLGPVSTRKKRSQ